jgi:hypothetical protein
VPGTQNGAEPAPFRVEEPDFGRYRPRHDGDFIFPNGGAYSSHHAHNPDEDLSGPAPHEEEHSTPQSADAEPELEIEPERIASRFGRPQNGS